jgi:uncharacterized repeat protein (TIGR04076 family)
MAESYDVEIKVVSQKGYCGAGHKVGDTWNMGATTVEGICASALNSIYPDFRVLRFGGELPWEEDKDTATIACPDAINPVVFEIRRKR